MLIRLALIPAILICGLALIAVQDAEASPQGVVSQHVFPGGVYVSGGVGIPIRARAPRRARHARRVRHVGGYYRTVYETRIERVWHPRELIGHDSHGHPVFSPGHWDEVEVQVPVRVWVPRRTIVRRARRVAPARGYVSIGGAFRIR